MGVGAVSFLIAEDDALIGRSLGRELGEHGHAVVVGTLEEARGALASQSFSAVIVDVGLPDGSGLELISEARAKDPEVAALVVSGGVDERRLATAHHLGASYLLKPVDAAELHLFAVRTRARVRTRTARVEAVVARWALVHELTEAETDVLRLAARGARRSQLASLRGVAPSTVKKQVQVLLGKTGDVSLESAVSRLLREVLHEVERVPPRSR
ncbi:MAG: response regulator [Labilithrix sp.]|nr:response regulator [Labilithrix sp.]